MSNSFMEIDFELSEMRRRKEYKELSRYTYQKSVATTVPGGSIMDGFYRDATEKGKSGGRSAHLGIDISLPKSGDGSYTDPRRSATVYVAINTNLSATALNTVRAIDKKADKKLTGLGIPISGDAKLVEGIIKPQPWKPTDDDSYGGIVGVACHYQYTKQSGGTDFFTIYVEYLHLITDSYLPKNKAGVIATAAEWTATGKPKGFGPDIKANAKWSNTEFLGPVYAIAGYLGATQTPHVHVQAAYMPGKVEYARDIRLDPELIIL
jgi:hypothetical protein